MIIGHINRAKHLIKLHAVDCFRTINCTFINSQTFLYCILIIFTITYTIFLSSFKKAKAFTMTETTGHLPIKWFILD